MYDNGTHGYYILQVDYGRYSYTEDGDSYYTPCYGSSTAISSSEPGSEYNYASLSGSYYSYSYDY